MSFACWHQKMFAPRLLRQGDVVAGRVQAADAVLREAGEEARLVAADDGAGVREARAALLVPVVHVGVELHQVDRLAAARLVQRLEHRIADGVVAAEGDGEEAGLHDRLQPVDDGVVVALGRPHGAERHVAAIRPAHAAEEFDAGLAVPEGLGVALEGVHGGGLAQGARPHPGAGAAGRAFVPADADDGDVGVGRRRRRHQRRLEEGRDAAERQCVVGHVVPPRAPPARGRLCPYAMPLACALLTSATHSSTMSQPSANSSGGMLSAGVGRNQLNAGS